MAVHNTQKPFSSQIGGEDIFLQGSVFSTCTGEYWQYTYRLGRWLSIEVIALVSQILSLMLARWGKIFVIDHTF
jgi:hypothetical protein